MESCNLKALLQGLRKRFHSFDFVRIGESFGQPIVLIQPQNFDPALPNILIASGTHGEELGGPWGILEWARKNEPILAGVNLSILPVVNPAAFVAGIRYNPAGETSNDGFGSGVLSTEGQVLWSHRYTLRFFAQDGFLSLHENAWRDKFFFYLDARRGSTEGLPEALRSVPDGKILQLPDGEWQSPHEGTYLVEDGIVWGDGKVDGTLERWLLNQGTPVAVVPEIPILGTPFEDRVVAHSRVIEAFLDWIRKAHVSNRVARTWIFGGSRKNPMG